MRRDKIYEDLAFSTDFSVEDWNNLIGIMLGKYFINETIFNKNKEILRTELINYLQFVQKTEYLELFDWIFDLFRECIRINKEETIIILANSFNDVSNTDMKWMANVLTQPDSNKFSERDKISYYFKAIDETLEGVFKPRFKLLDKLIKFKLGFTLVDNSNFDFGKLIRDSPIEFENDIKLLLKDPICSIPTSQWRNIAAHKSYVINKNNIVIEYGRTNIQQVHVSFEEFYSIVRWTQDIYKVIRLSQVFIYLNYTKEIVTELGSIENMSIRFESKLLHIVHNMQIVGFQFVSTEEKEDVFCLSFKGKDGYDIKSSIIHASQCLDQLSFAIYNDEFVRDDFQRTKINIVDEDFNNVASATISIEIALKKGRREIDLEEYINNIHFEIKDDHLV